MSRIDETMAALATKKRKALVAYLCMGDPSHEASIEHAVACAKAGADVLELGVPFSDPTADGATIARASERALRAGGGLARAIDAARAIRARTAVPLLLFGYYNPVFVRGEARTVKDARDAGVDGLLVVDLPVDEAAPLRALCKQNEMSLVPLLAPTSSAARVEATARAVREAPPGFVYYVSLTGVTGAAEAPLAQAGARAAELRAALKAPVVVGFGIDSPEKARAAAKDADGVVVGSALVRLVASGRDPSELIGDLRRSID
ncbi:MAG TPA: tryptophan synthase subunit alpha [Polyangiaceae bacterium]|jgi:tryptophan synthase alpha chain